MLAISVTEFGAPEVLKVATLPKPSPGAQQVLVRVVAAGVNPVETYRRSGNYAGLPTLPWTPGADAAGVVEKSGDGASRFKGGERVWLSGCLTGTYAQYLLANEVDVHILPEAVSFEQGASVYIAYATAYHALFQIAKPNRNGPNTILIHGASGGVGVAAVQFAKQLGGNTKIIGTAGTQEGLDALLSIGVNHVLNHKTDDFKAKVLEFTDGKGVDIIIEMLANVNLAKDLTVLALGGRVAVVGNRGSIEINPRDLMGKRASVHGVMLGNATSEERQEFIQAINKGLADGTLKPIVGKKFALAQAPDSHTYILNPPQGALGKVILSPWE